MLFRGVLMGVFYSNEFKDLCRNYDVTVEPGRLKFNVFSQFYPLCLSSL